MLEHKEIKVDTVRFSIIVPIYNVEQYLGICIESLLKQNYTNYEIILIDDGSKDSSGQICDKYAQKNSLVRVIHKKNGGLSSARNTGIVLARGEYLLFIDSDDYIRNDSLEIFSTCLDNYDADIDIIAAKAYLLENNKIKPKIKGSFYTNLPISGKEYFEKATKNKSLMACAPFNVYRKEFIIDNRLFFKENIVHEDELWTPQVFFYAKNVVSLDFLFYFHRIRNNSITQKSDEISNIKKSTDLLDNCNELLKFTSSFSKTETIYLRDRIAMLYMNAVFIGKLYKRANIKIDRFIPIRNSKTIKNFIKSLIFMISPCFYCFIDSIIKKI